MRLRTWIAVVISVVLLAAAGTIGILVNRSALRAADQVHRADSRALGVNNKTLVGAMQRLSASELGEFLNDNSLHLGRDSAVDRTALRQLAAKSTYFSYGALLLDLKGTVLTSSRDTGVPAMTDAGWKPMLAMLAADQTYGVSSIMSVDATYLEAVAVPVMVGGGAVALLVGLNDVAHTPLQKYTVSLGGKTHLTTIVDSTGTIAATSDSADLGHKVDPAIRAALAADPNTEFVEYTDVSGAKMIAIVVGGLPGGWAYVRTQSQASFDGAVHSKSQTLNLTLLAMLLIGVLAIAALGYRTMKQRRQADQRFQALFQHAPDLVSVLDVNGDIEYSSPSAKAILGFEQGQLVGSSVFDIIHPDDRGYMREQFALLLSRRDAVLRLQCRSRSVRGEYRWFEFTASNQMHNPALHGVVINARDISETRAFQERLAHEAQHDALTGLPNRRRMQDALGASLREQPVGVLFVDLDGFKPVNDAHGHEAGDELLRQVARRLTGCVREGDVLARVGGDEFVVLMPGVAGDTDTGAACDRIRSAIEKPFTIDGIDVRIGASVGVHLAPSAGDPDEALRAADHAMYAVKKSGRDRRSTGGRHRAAD
ncbi:sensor domain-containing diguanylate cyclase [Actinoplanes sp. NPDC048796]|uniref:sensor domain-containing diguanylate cyclase n=1 Tax=unclassified Actinoplanes TaxID=2626549 RepID=UPI0033E4189C